MKKPSLSLEERDTLQSYEVIGKVFNQTRGDPTFWGKEFRYFQSLLPSGRILDVGCGAGRDSILFTRGGFNYVGIDLSDSMLESAREVNPLAQFSKMDIYSLDFPKGWFDGFWAAASILHTPKSRVDLMLTEIVRVIRPGGVGFVAVKEGKGEGMVYQDRWKVNRFFALYQQEELKEVLEKAGMDVLWASKKRYVEGPAKTTWLCYFLTVK